MTVESWESPEMEQVRIWLVAVVTVLSIKVTTEKHMVKNYTLTQVPYLLLTSFLREWKLVIAS